MKLNFRIKSLVLLTAILLISCKDNSEPTTESELETELETFLCCGENPFLSENINNLDQTNGVIYVESVFTPNGDGYRDNLGLYNIEFYENNYVTIYDIDDNIVFFTENYNPLNNFFNGNNYLTEEELESGTYKYKLVVDNEETFTEYGYVCLLKNGEDANGYFFSIECSLDYSDPIIM